MGSALNKPLLAKASQFSRLGYRMPAEWEAHAATWLAWPHNRDTWPGKLEAMPGVWCAMIQALYLHEQVHVLVNDSETLQAALACLAEAGIEVARLQLQVIPTNDAWIRDYGPTFVEGPAEKLIIIDWRYNAWGGKFPPWDLDDQVRSRVAALLGLEIFQPGYILEGGSLDVNGRGTLLTTDICLLNPNRNPHLGRAEIEASLGDCLGVSHVIWLSGGIVGDETDGHIDILARFVDPATVVVAVEEDPRDENYEPLQDNYRRLRGAADQNGRPLRVLPLPMPRPVFHQTRRLPLSYANFYIANNVVLAPTYDDPNDAKALALLQALFPTRRLVGIPCTDLMVGGGAIHCVTQQQPAPRGAMGG